MKRFLCLVILGAVVALTACTKKEEAKNQGPLQENNPAPAITVNSLAGKPLNLSDLKGKVVILNFWATWCPPCREEIPSMMKLNSAMAGKPFQMVAVSIDEGGQPAIEAFFKTSGFSLPAYTDPDNRAAKAYGITGVPETFVIDKNGILLKRVIGPMAWDSPDVLSYLEGLMK
ncbi:TlpA disulfide reductase family protein [Geobacter sp. AOG2]|uniref:TlpA disulfide reductase family protein n=1 Tax=Geobacter sp. AOG2 TaxID=1566347 RepID=UPI001CC6C92F|nr:TlpA disulfide reductase family protein [Geobacter sp. AOG2]GFE61237.1 thioredoxin [Geobacter sp. AOG2]